MTGAQLNLHRLAPKSPETYSELMDSLSNGLQTVESLASETEAWLDRCLQFLSVKRIKFALLGLQKVNEILQRSALIRERLVVETGNVEASLEAGEKANVSEEHKKVNTKIREMSEAAHTFAEKLKTAKIIGANNKLLAIYDHQIETKKWRIAIIFKLLDVAGVGYPLDLTAADLDTINDTTENLAHDPRNAVRLIMETGVNVDSAAIDSIFAKVDRLETGTHIAHITNKVLQYPAGNVIVTTVRCRDKKALEVADQLGIQGPNETLTFKAGDDGHNFFSERDLVFTVESRQVKNPGTGRASKSELKIMSVEPTGVLLDSSEAQSILDSFTGDTLTPDTAREIVETLLACSEFATKKEVPDSMPVATRLPKLSSNTDALIRRIFEDKTTSEDEDKLAAVKLAQEQSEEDDQKPQWWQTKVIQRTLGNKQTDADKKRMEEVCLMRNNEDNNVSITPPQKLSALDQRIRRLAEEKGTAEDLAIQKEQQEKLALEAKSDHQPSFWEKVNTRWAKFVQRVNNSWAGRLFPRFFTSGLFDSDRANAIIADSKARTNADPTTTDNNDIPSPPIKTTTSISSKISLNTQSNRRRMTIAAVIAALTGVAIGVHNKTTPRHHDRGISSRAGTRTNRMDAGISSNPAETLDSGMSMGFAANQEAAVSTTQGNLTDAQTAYTNAVRDANGNLQDLAVLAAANEVHDASVLADENTNVDPRSIGRDFIPANDTGVQVPAQDAVATDTPTVVGEEPLPIQQQVDANPAVSPNAPLTVRPFFIAGTSSGDVNGALRAHPNQHNDSRERFVVHGVDQILTLVAPGLTASEHQRAAGSIGHLVDGQITTYLAEHPAVARRFGRIHHGDHGHIDIEEVANRHGGGTHRVFHIQLQRPDHHGNDQTVLDLKIPERTVQGIIAQHTSEHTEAATVQHNEHPHAALRITQHVRRLTDNGNNATDTGGTASYSPARSIESPSDHHPARRVRQRVRQLGERVDTTRNQTVLPIPVTAPITAPVAPVVASQAQGTDGARRVVQHVRRLSETRQVAADRVVNTGVARAPNPQPQALPIVVPTATPPVARPTNTATYERNVSRTVDHFNHLSESQKNALQNFISRFNTQLSSLSGEDSGNVAASLEYNNHGHPVLNIDISMDNHGRVRAQIPFLVVRRADGSIDLETDTRAAVLPRAREEELNTSLISFGIVPITQADHSLHLDRVNTGIYGTPRVGKHNPMDRALRSVLRQARFISYVAATATSAAQISATQPYETNPTTRESIIGALMTAIRETLNTRAFGHTPPRQPAVDRHLTDPIDNPNDPLGGLGDLGLKAYRRAVDDDERDRLLREIDQMFNNPPSQTA